MALVNKNFRIKNGLIVEGSTATVNGSNILTENSVEFIQDTIAALITGGTHTNISVSYNDPAGTLSFTGAVTYTDEQAQDAIGNYLGTGLSYNDSTGAISVTANTYDAYGAAAAAQSAAASDATSKANAAQAAAEATAAAALSSAISTEVSNRNTAISTAIDSVVDGAPSLLNTLNELAAAINDDANYTTTITTALGTKAPLASPALTGTPTAPTASVGTNTTQIATTAYAKAAADAAQSAATTAAASDATSKANAAQAAAEATAAADATSKANAAQSAAASDATSKVAAEATARATAVTAAIATAASDATSKANAAQSAATTAAASDATSKANAAQVAAEATAAAANTAQQNGTTAFTAVNVNSVAKQVAATTGNIVTAAETTAYSWAKASYRSAEFLVKSKNGTHTEVTKIMLTLDTSDNIYLTEYGMSSTSGSALQTVSADVSGTDVRIRVTPANNNTEVLITGTLLV